MDRAAALRKVAVVIESVDGPTAETLLAQLAPERAALVRQTLLQLGPVDRAEREVVLSEFLCGHALATAASSKPVAGEPEHAAGPAVPRALPAEPAEASRSEAPAFAFLDGVSPETIAGCLADEHPQTSSVVLAHLPAATAAEVLQHLPPEQQVDVLRGIARLQRTDPSVLAEIEQTLQQAWRHRLRPAAAPVGVAAVEAILDAGGYQDRPALLALLEQRDPQLLRRLGYAERIRGPRLAIDSCADGDDAAWDHHATRRTTTDTRPPAAPAEADRAASLPSPCHTDEASSRDALDFEDLIALDDSALATIFRAADPHIALLALTGASPQLAERMLGQLPGREASELARQMEALGPIRLQDVACAQQRIADLVRQLARQGTIQLPQARYFTEAA
jgi:flagellar motor switch protein FliG